MTREALKPGDTRVHGLDLGSFSGSCVYTLIRRKFDKQWWVLVLDSDYPGEKGGDVVAINESWLLRASGPA